MTLSFRLQGYRNLGFTRPITSMGSDGAPSLLLSHPKGLLPGHTLGHVSSGEKELDSHFSVGLGGVPAPLPHPGESWVSPSPWSGAWSLLFPS